MIVKDLSKTEGVATREGYGEGLVEAGKKDKNVVVLCADLTESTRSADFKKTFPERFIETGIAEQNMAGVAAGLALSGKVPFTSSYAVFNPGRNWEQVRVSIAYSKANVKICGAHAGLSVGPDGATHQALEDIAIMRVLPNMTVLVPCDYLEAKKATLAAAEHAGPVYIRLTREKTPVFTTAKSPFKIGMASALLTSKSPKVTVVGCGPILYEALMAAKALDKSLPVEVINSASVKPLDEETIIRSAKKTGAVVTVEEHQVAGGLGGAVSELLAEKFPVPVVKVGVKDQFGESGQPKELFKKYKLTSSDIATAIKKANKLR